MTAEERANRAFEDIVAIETTDPMHAVKIIYRHILAAEREAERATIERCAEIANQQGSPTPSTIAAWIARNGRKIGTITDEERVAFCHADCIADEIRALPSAYGEET